MALWLILHNWVPKTVEEATGPIKSLYELSSLLGASVTLAALSFFAYLLGSILRFRYMAYPGRIVLAGIDLPSNMHVTWYYRRVQVPLYRWRAENMAAQLDTFMSTRLRESEAVSRLDTSELESILNHPMARAIASNKSAEGVLVKSYVAAIAFELESVGIQLQAKNRDFWDTYDRHAAEAEFRYGIDPPIVTIICILAIQSGHVWWLPLLVLPLMLFINGARHSIDAADTLVQAVVLKMVEPPVLERLKEAISKKEREIAVKP